MREIVFGSSDLGRIRTRIEQGAVPASIVIEVALASLDLTIEGLAAAMDVSVRTLSRRSRAGGTLALGEADRVYRLFRIADLATEMIGDRARAVRWLHSPSLVLGNETPLQMLRTEIGTLAVEQSLYAIGYGGVA
jgi:putative toxin-antitoxin system antitoxin component (TIGR02293 family)